MAALSKVSAACRVEEPCKFGYVNGEHEYRELKTWCDCSVEQICKFGRQDPLGIDRFFCVEAPDVKVNDGSLRSANDRIET